MKEEIIEFKNIINSKELYESRNNVYYSYFIYTLFVIVLIISMFLIFFKIDVVVDVEGSIRPNDGVWTIASTISGRVTQKYYYDTKIVSKGEKLFEIDSTEDKELLSSLEDKYKKIDRENENHKKYLECITNQVNNFNSDTNSDEYSFYVQYEQYRINLRKSLHSIEYDTKKVDEDLLLYKEKREKLNAELEGLIAYKKTIEEDDDTYIEDYPIYQDMYRSYLYEITTLDNKMNSEMLDVDIDSADEDTSIDISSVNSQISNYTKLLNSIKSGTSKFDESDESNVKYLYEEYLSTYEIYNASAIDGEETNDAKSYRNKKIAEYQKIIDDLNLEHSKLGNQRKDLKHKWKQRNYTVRNYETALKSLYYETLNDINDKIKSKELELQEIVNLDNNNKILKGILDNKKDLNGQNIEINEITINEIDAVLKNIKENDDILYNLKNEINRTKKNIEKSIVLAPQNGVVNEIININVGDVIESMNIIGTVVPNNTNENKVIMYVSNYDIGKISVGNDVKFNIYALPYNEYGIATGKIIKKTNDSLKTNDEHFGYYLVESSINEKYLKRYDGSIGDFVIGMQTKGKIITSKKTILRYLLERIGMFW